MKTNKFAILIKLLIALHLSALCVSEDFDFFYFVQSWPGSYCDTKHHCCYPGTGKPVANFSIHGLWPNYRDGHWPANCNPDNVFDRSEISDLIPKMEKVWPTLACPSSNGMKFWSHEWNKHGTCSESELDQHDYFETALKLKDKIDLLRTLKDAGIEPNDEFYGFDRIKQVIKDAIGFTPGIECNVDADHNSQLYQIYLCVDTSGTEFIECPILPRDRCAKKVQFPAF